MWTQFFIYFMCSINNKLFYLGLKFYEILWILCCSILRLLRAQVLRNSLNSLLFYSSFLKIKQIHTCTCLIFFSFKERDIDLTTSVFRECILRLHAEWTVDAFWTSDERSVSECWTIYERWMRASAERRTQN